MLIDNIKDRIKNDIKTIVLPESMDERIIDAANEVASEGLANIILIGNPCKEINSTNIKIIIPEKSVFVKKK